MYSGTRSLGVAVVNHCAWGGLGAWPLQGSSPHLSLLLPLLPAKEPAGHAPDGRLPGPLRRPCLLLAAAHSLLEDEEPAPARGPVDRAAPPAPLQPLHCPLGDQYPLGAGLGVILHWGGLLCASVHVPVIGQSSERAKLPGLQPPPCPQTAGGGSAGFLTSSGLGFLICQMQSQPQGWKE